MTWEEQLFGLLDELEQQADAAFALDRDDEVADRSRAEYRQVSLAARLMASTDEQISVQVVGVGTLTGTLDRVAAGWCLLRCSGQDWVIRLDAVAAAGGVSARAVPELAWPATARLGLGSLLRRLAETGERCVVHRVDGGRHDGVPRRVGADFVEIEEPARLTLVALTSLAAVQSVTAPD